MFYPTSLEAVEILLNRVWSDVENGNFRNAPRDPYSALIGARDLLWIQSGPFTEECDLISSAIEQVICRQYYSEPGDNWLCKIGG